MFYQLNTNISCLCNVKIPSVSQQVQSNKTNTFSLLYHISCNLLCDKINVVTSLFGKCHTVCHSSCTFLCDKHLVVTSVSAKCQTVCNI